MIFLAVTFFFGQIINKLQGGKLFPDRMNKNHLDLILGRRNSDCCIMENLKILSTKFDMLKFSEKTLSLPKAPWPKQEKSGTPPCFDWMTWRCHGILYVHFYFSIFFFFLFRSNVRKGYLHEGDIHHFYGNFFRKCYSESYLITDTLKFLLKNYEAY